jgi:HlyD family secretion protein
MPERLLGLTAPTEDFSPPLLRLQRAAPSPLPRVVLRVAFGLLTALFVWAMIGRLDIVSVAQGKLVPMTYLKVLQPAEGGIVQELLVGEGDEVHVGQVLMRMDRRVSEADGRQIANELVTKRLQLARIDAELSGQPMKRRSEDPPDLYAQALAQFHARRSAYQDALAGERAALARAEQDYWAARQQEQKLVATAPLARQQEEGWNQLMKEGFAGRLMALDKTRARIETEQELAAQRHAVESLKSAIEQSRNRLAQISSNYLQQLSTERVEVETQYRKLHEDEQKQLLRHGLLELKAPQDGIVKDLATHTPGTVVQPGTILMTLVPKSEPVQAEVWVSNLDAGFVQAGQRAKLKFATYPFQEYGMAEGKVSHVSPDATEAGTAKSQTAGSQDNGVSQNAPAGYRTLVTLASPFHESEGKRYRVSPGMQVTAEIHLGTRTVMEYLLSPVRKLVFEAGRER